MLDLCYMISLTDDMNLRCMNSICCSRLWSTLFTSMVDDSGIGYDSGRVGIMFAFWSGILYCIGLPSMLVLSVTFLPPLLSYSDRTCMTSLNT